jgi:hypothetical protein
MSTMIRYERNDDLIRLTLRGMTNHELREVILGLWCRLDRADRLDHINELAHYAVVEEAFLSPVAAAIMTSMDEEGVVDLAALVAKGERIKP